MSISKTLKRPEVGIIAMCDLAKQLEDSGEYVKAAKAMGEWWQGIGVRPDMGNQLAGKKAAILSRIGALSGWLGSTQQVPGSQERAKDLISEGADLFESIDFKQEWAEARSDLAVCYWREGAFEEARIILQDVLNSGVIFSPELKEKILLRLVTVEISTKHFEAASVLINQVASLIEEEENSLLLGKFYFYRAFTLRSQGEDQNNHDLLLAAVEDYQRAGQYYEKIKHGLFAANVENNLGNVYRLLNDYKNAHSHLDKAIYLFIKLKDQANAALVYENKAQAFLAENKLEDAEIAAHTSVKMVRKGDEKSILAESLTTLGIVLSRGGNLDEAIRSFNEAKETALKVGDTESAGNAVLTQMEELQSHLSPIIFRALYMQADELLKNSPKISTINRLQRIVRKQFEISGFQIEEPADAQQKTKLLSQANKLDSLFESGKVKLVIDWENFSLPEAVRSFEGEIILKALSETNGRVTRAARLLGLSHQSLSLILHQRHKELNKFCVQRKPRSSKVNSH